MSTPAWGRALCAALVLAVAAPSVVAETPLPPPSVELELSGATELSHSLPHMPPGIDCARPPAGADAHTVPGR